MTDRRPLLNSEENPPAGPPQAPPQATGMACVVVEEPPPAAPPPPPAPRLNLGHYLILISLNSIGAFSSDCYVPNLSQVGKDLSATDQQVSLTIQINWILLGLATPIIGHLSDVHGRKRVVCVTMLIYIAGALGSAYAPTIEWMIIARCVQGVGEAVSIITSAIIRDTIDDPQERMQVQAYFTTMRPLMLLGGPSIGGAIGSACGWRNLMRGLAVWGALTLLLVGLLPESLPRDETAAKPKSKLNPCAIICPGLTCAKLRRMSSHVDFVFLSGAAAISMGAVRSMLSNISFVYDHYYRISTALSGVLISAPTMAGFLSAMVAARFAKGTPPGKLMRIGMAAGVVPPAMMLVVAGLPGSYPNLYDAPHWYMTTIPCSLLAAVGFFALPAMQVLVLQDFKDMSGLAGGVSKLVMTLTSTGMSMLVSAYFSDWGADKPDHYTHFHTQRLLYSLAAILIVAQIWFWLLYVPIKRCAALPSAGGASPAPTPSLRRRMTRQFSLLRWNPGGSGAVDGSVTRSATGSGTSTPPDSSHESPRPPSREASSSSAAAPATSPGEAS